eukprot:gene17951-biopygen10715
MTVRDQTSSGCLQIRALCVREADWLASLIAVVIATRRSGGTVVGKASTGGKASQIWRHGDTAWRHALRHISGTDRRGGTGAAQTDGMGAQRRVGGRG